MISVLEAATLYFATDPVQWTEKMMAEFGGLKAALTSASTVGLPDFNEKKCFTSGTSVIKQHLSPLKSPGS